MIGAIAGNTIVLRFCEQNGDLILYWACKCYGY